ncbi:GNAT family N-acetyltransferase [Flavihumibacter rivuli]|uniref:GNAT family N-acetyltransferase n=1 Tax=Flavihumibacter rivuli TaxID=2838156 RepID=UPI001BDDD7C0|nr:GNAT family N-acetyltransferase [Flavihumibacter rivuli]ULQ55850.1 GNAT family N-acetyltransferase [Flavihumibacter rivuli]
MITIYPISEESIGTSSRSLSRAFMNDPLQTYVFPTEREREQKSPAHFEAVLRYGNLFGEVYTTQNLEGAVVWLTPGSTDVTPEKAEKGGLGNIHALLGEDAANRFFSVMDFLDPFHKQDAPEPHWYTMVIGVDPAFSGLGLGKALMQHILTKAQGNQTSVYLETAQPSNIKFYSSLGFTVLRELTEPKSKLPLWTFKKDF